MPARARAAAFASDCLPLRFDSDLAALLAGLTGSPFQSPALLTSWFATYAGRGEARECFLLTLKDARGQVVFALPLVRNRRFGLSVLELPHSGVIDFTVPLMRAGGAPLPEPEALWALLLKALPPADLVVMRRLDRGRSGLANPLYALPQTLPSLLVSWRVEPLAAPAARHAGLSKPFRKKLRRNREKLLAQAGVKMVVARSAGEALPLLAAMEAMQSTRIRGKGLDYGLDCERTRDFHRRFLSEGTSTGGALMAALVAGERVICAGLAVLDQDFAVYLRVASDFGEYAALTPGLVITDLVMDEAHARGIRVFDFGMGSYRFKRQMGGSPRELRDLICPLSARGWVAATLVRGMQRARMNPLLRTLAGRGPLGAPLD